jgi:peptide/nickel transport system permease protein
MNKENKMAQHITGVENLTLTEPHISEARRVIRVFFGRKFALFGAIIILILIITAIFAPWLAPYDPYEMNLDIKLQSPSASHLLGTDNLGRDTLSRIIYGTRTSLIIGITSVGTAAIIGESLGLCAGYFGGVIYAVIMRFADTLMSIPMIINAMIIATVLGGGIKNVIIALAIGQIAGHIRLMCSQTLTIKQNDYISASHSIGSNDIRIMLRHILPNAFPPLLVMVTIQFGSTILAEAGLSFLGIGLVPPICAWGSMINDGYKFMLSNPVLSFAPGVAVMLVVFGFNMMGDGLRDALDPRLRGAF